MSNNTTSVLQEGVGAAEVAPVPSRPHLSWLNRNVAGMALTSLLSDMGHEMATAILPLFLASIGASAAALGIIEGIADAVSSFVKLGAGWYSDRIGKRKEIAVAGYAITGVTTGLFALATAWPHLLAARTAGWLGRGIRGPVRDAILAESVTAEARGRAFGFHRAGDTTGAILGPVIALGLVSAAFTYRQIFLISMIPGLLAALAFALFVSDRVRAANKTQHLVATIRVLPKSFRLYLVGVTVFGLGDFAHSLLTLHAVQMLTPSLGMLQAGAIGVSLYVLHNVVYALASFPAGALGDRFGKRGVLAGGYLLASVMAVGFIVAPPQVWYLALLFGLGGAFIAVEDALEGAVAGDLLPEDVRGTGYGVLATVNGLGDFCSSIIVGLLWATALPAAGFAYTAILATIGAAIIYRVR